MGDEWYGSDTLTDKYIVADITMAIMNYHSQMSSKIKISRPYVCPTY